MRSLGILIAGIRASFYIQTTPCGRSESRKSAIESAAGVVVPLSSFGPHSNVPEVDNIPSVTILFLKVLCN